MYGPARQRCARSLIASGRREDLLNVLGKAPLGDKVLSGKPQFGADVRDVARELDDGERAVRVNDDVDQ
jgi:hypothetical protein